MGKKLHISKETLTWLLQNPSIPSLSLSSAGVKAWKTQINQ